MKAGVSSGYPCDISAQTSGKMCVGGLSCTCLAANRGLHICMQPTLLSVPVWAQKWERQGLVCDTRLPAGLRVMPSPPVIESSVQILDPRKAGDSKLREWALGPGHSFYTQYATVHAPGETVEGVPILAGNDVSKKKFTEFVAAARHFLLEAAVDSAILTSLSRNGVRILVAGRKAGHWRRHPEVNRHFATGLGGGSPWFPSTEITSDSLPEDLEVLEELFHTIQYVVMRPRDVCMYHKAYAHAVASKLYTTDGSATEVDGEPVPTVQADEHLAMALMRWFGNGGGLNEYRVQGSSSKSGMETGREHLRKHDPQAFCIIAKFFRSDDTWNPTSRAQPWKTNPNRAMDVGEVASFCEPILAEAVIGCPAAEVGGLDQRGSTACKNGLLHI